jgi:transglutaminase-like putative cysteine protease
LAHDAVSDADKVERLCRFVYRNIAYARSTVWLKPLDVLRLGFGDCRCQAILLRELLRLCDLDACIAVGIVRRRRGSESTHTWVEIRLGEEGMICDPTLSPRPLTPGEYDIRMAGVLDVTPEYAMKRPDLRVIMRRN